MPPNAHATPRDNRPQRCRQRYSAEGMADPVRGLPGLLDDEISNGWQVMAHVLRHVVVSIVFVARRQTVAAHFGDPHIEPRARQVRPQANALRRIPEAPIGKAAMQQYHGHATLAF